MSEDSHTLPANDQDRLAGALDTVAQVVLGEELEGIRRGLRKQEARLGDRITAIDERLAGLDEEVKKAHARATELRLKIDEARDDQNNAHSAVESRIERAIEDLGRRVDDARAHADESLGGVRRELEEGFSSRESGLRAQVEDLAGTVAELQFELRQQLEASQRLSALMDNLSAIFSTGAGGLGRPEGGSSDAGRGSESGGSGEDAPALRGSEGDSGLEIALDETLGIESMEPPSDP